MELSDQDKADIMSGVVARKGKPVTAAQLSEYIREYLVEVDKVNNPGQEDDFHKFYSDLAGNNFDYDLPAYITLFRKFFLDS